MGIDKLQNESKKAEARFRDADLETVHEGDDEQDDEDCVPESAEDEETEKEVILSKSGYISTY